ncbi:uncharacterized protein I206_105415 [Kwoniella pini CBS 10737]|uniref:Uncharacterized protein n=1 Tax=Kwoniella pini CBS 10737 TaxID=1296096 RepID=A0A1B9I4B7_9TREE|nr:uncharacterized protein I206_03679 [Kwoniella pini CBS 10737]OCF50358.1 hypothetical protein I206_03679 [Kwoniella pini CBS 10737]
MILVRLALFVLFLTRLDLVYCDTCEPITATATATQTATVTGPTVVTVTTTVHVVQCTETQSHTTTITDHRRTDTYTTTTRTPTVTRTSTVATHHITVTSPGRTIFVPCPTTRVGSTEDEKRQWADKNGLSNSKRLQLGLPLAKPHYKKQVQPSDRVPGRNNRVIASCTPTYITETETNRITTTLIPTTTVTTTSCAWTTTKDTTSYGRTTVTDTSTHIQTRVGPATTTIQPVTTTQSMYMS